METAFDRQTLYELLCKIPYGRVVTYGRLAEMMGNRHFARAVGNALHANPDGDLYRAIKRSTATVRSVAAMRSAVSKRKNGALRQKASKSLTFMSIFGNTECK